MTLLCHNLTNLARARRGSRRRDGTRAAPQGLKRRFRDGAGVCALSNLLGACYISRAARTPPRRNSCRGVEQPGSSSGS
jgi:hypothetical protein